MRDSEAEREKKRVLAFVKKWQTLLGLNNWTISYEWSREGIDADPEHQNWSTLFRCTVKWEYRDAYLEVNLGGVQDLSDHNLEPKILHELCHILVNELREFSTGGVKHEERVVCDLTNAFLCCVRAAAHGDLKPA